MAYHKVSQITDIPEDTGACVQVAGRRIALFKDDGEVYAVDDVCPHEGGPISQGFYEARVVTCPMHAWDFDVVSGRVKGGVETLETFPVRVDDDGSVYVSVE